MNDGRVLATTLGLFNAGVQSRDKVCFINLAHPRGQVRSRSGLTFRFAAFLSLPIPGTE